MRRFYRCCTAIASLGAFAAGVNGPAYAQDGSPLSESYDLGTLVISATGFAQQIVDAPATITVIDGEDIASKPYSSVADVVRDRAPALSSAQVRPALAARKSRFAGWARNMC